MDNSEYTKLAIWVAVVGITFVILWRKGYLAKLTTYAQQTREELRKCTWPTMEELRGSTVIVMISVVMLGVFTFCVDFVFGQVVRLLMQA